MCLKEPWSADMFHLVSLISQNWRFIQRYRSGGLKKTHNLIPQLLRCCQSNFSNGNSATRSPSVECRCLLIRHYFPHRCTFAPEHSLMFHSASVWHVLNLETLETMPALLTISRIWQCKNIASKKERRNKGGNSKESNPSQLVSF